MKRKLNIILLIGFICLWSCDDQLYLEPTQSIKSEDVYATSDNIINALTGAYNAMRDDNTFVGAFIDYSEILATTNNVRFNGSWGDYKNLRSKVINVDNNEVYLSWRDAYYAISIANTVLDKLDVVDTELQDRVQGEALIIRGWTLFELTRLYGHTYDPDLPNNDQDGVPIVLQPAYLAIDAQMLSRSSVEECYQQAIDDLLAAKTLLEDYGKNGSKLNTYAASAILSRIYLQQGEYEDAALEASRVIESGLFNLELTPLNAFNNPLNSTEDIFAFQANSTSYSNRLAVLFASLNDAGRGDYAVSQTWIDGFEVADLRGGLQEDTEDSYTYNDLTDMYYIGVGSINYSGGINTSKWGNYYNAIPMIRLAEMYLTRAEGNFEEGTTHGATPLDDINMIRNRAGLVDAGAISLALIQDERLKELCWEGHRLHDMKRWKMSIGSLTYDANSLVLPIPLREREVNTNLTQNPGYLD